MKLIVCYFCNRTALLLLFCAAGLTAYAQSMQSQYFSSRAVPAQGASSENFSLQQVVAAFVAPDAKKTGSNVAEDRTITGTVTDATNGEPLIGANILVVGTTIGTVTDVDGEFSLTVPDDAQELEISYTGYAAKRVAIGASDIFNVSLQPGELLEEVVVVGYGTQKKRDVTAAISSVDEEAIQRIPVASTAQALQGQVAGLDVQSTGGRPGQYPSVRIRGRRSINASNEPLYVVDGIPLTDNGTAFDINPQDIKSVEILKDAAATAIYGSRGANGVILITTRRGGEGKTTVTYDGYYGISSVTKTVDMMNGQEFADLKRESRRDGYNGTIPPDEQVFDDPVELESIALGRSTDYQDLVLDNGHQQNHQVGIRGGNARTQFLFSFNFFNEQGIIPTQDFDRYSLRLNVDHQISNWLKVGTSTYLSRSDQNWASNPMGEALSNNPLGVPYDDEGNLLFLPTNDGIRTNPLSEIVPGAYIDERNFNSTLASLYAEAQFAKNFTFRSTFGPDIRFRRRGLFTDSETNARRGAPPQARKEERKIFGYTLENLLTYNKQFNQTHDLTVTLLQSIQERDEENTWVEVRGLPYSSQAFNNLGTAEEILNFGSNVSEWQLASLMGRITYSLAGKYLVQVSARADGSSRLSPGNKWALFPGASVGWRLSEEGFLQDAGALSDLKLRISYGEVGNTSIDPYQTQGALNRTTYLFGDQSAFGYGLGDIPNADLTWEKTATVDFGLDFALWDGRLSGSIDYYIANTTDLLLERQLPFTSGYTSILENVGATRNKGVEIALKSVNLNTAGGFRWSTDLNFFKNNEEIVELFNGTDDDIGNRWFIGQPIGVFYDFEKIGIWQLNEADQASQFGDVPGEIKLNDRNGDGKYDGEDRVILGTDIPDFTMGLINSFEFKGFDLSFFLYFRQGHMVYSNFHTGNNTLFGRYNNLDVDYWTPDNPTNAFPRPNQNQERPKYTSTMGYFDGSYVKLRNVTFGYTLPSTLTQKFRMSNLRLYFSAQNPWFTSKFDTYDPEVGQRSNNRQEDVSGDVPSAKYFLFGINTSF